MGVGFLSVSIIHLRSLLLAEADPLNASWYDETTVSRGNPIRAFSSTNPALWNTRISSRETTIPSTGRQWLYHVPDIGQEWNFLLRAAADSAKRFAKNISEAVLNDHHEDVKIRFHINLNSIHIYCIIWITGTNTKAICWGIIPSASRNCFTKKSRWILKNLPARLSHISEELCYNC